MLMAMFNHPSRGRGTEAQRLVELERVELEPVVLERVQLQRVELERIDD